MKILFLLSALLASPAAFAGEHLYTYLCQDISYHREPNDGLFARGGTRIVPDGAPGRPYRVRRKFIDTYIFLNRGPGRYAECAIEAHYCEGMGLLQSCQ